MKFKEVILHRAILAIVAVVMLFMLFTIGRNLVHALSIKIEISALEDNAKSYREQIQRDSTLIENLKYDDQLERYAREHYRMQKRGERVYIVE